MSPAESAATANRQPVVLLVEDEVVVRALLAEELRAAGMSVTEAANADEAWAFLKAGGEVDLLFSDVRMPGSMDGIGLMELVRQNFPDIKIVMTSGNLGPRNMGHIGRFLAKPYLISKAVAIAMAALGMEPPASP
jgi:CheY-like chemotaxis protein